MAPPEPNPSASRAFWRPYAQSSILLSIVLGFGLGAGLFTWRADDRAAGLGWLVSAQAHGHVQLYGWAGLLVLGVGMHFLPRLAHAQAVSRRSALTALALIFAGIVARTLTTTLLATRNNAAFADELRWLVLGSVALELTGVLLAVRALVMALRSGNSNRGSAFAAIAPLGILAMLSLITSLTIDVVNAAGLVSSDHVLLDETMTEVAVFVAQYGFLLPIAIAMSARLFPLYIRTRPADDRSLRGIATLLATGVVAGGIGSATEHDAPQALGSFAIAAAAVAALVALGILGERRQLPRQSWSVVFEPLQWFVASAYFWMAVAIVASLITAFDQLGIVTSTLSPAVQRHSFGAGFITVLIVGVGQSLLPGFARQTARNTSVLWLTLVLCNLATLLRVLPAAGWAPVGYAETLMAVAGGVGVVALIFFAWNIRLFAGSRPSREPS